MAQVARADLVSRAPYEQIRNGLRPASVGVKHLPRHPPPTPLVAGGERLLHRLVNRPPFLRLRVGRHLGGVSRPILAVILKIAEQQVLWFSQEDRIVTHVAVGNLGEHLRPYCGMGLLVLGDPLRLDADHYAHALHRGFSRCSYESSRRSAYL